MIGASPGCGRGVAATVGVLRVRELTGTTEEVAGKGAVNSVSVWEGGHYSGNMSWRTKLSHYRPPPLRSVLYVVLMPVSRP